MKVVQILTKLDTQSLNKLAKFVASPYFNTNELMIPFLAILRSNLSKSSELNKQDIWHHLYPDQPYVDARFRKLTHQLTSLIQDFFAVENLLQHQHKKHRSISEYCEANKIPDLRGVLKKKLDDTLDHKEIMWSEAYFDSYISYRNLIDFGVDFEKKKKYKNTEEYTKRLNVLQELLDTSYTIEKIRLSLHNNHFSHLISNDQIVEETLPIQVLHPIMTQGKSRLLNVYVMVYQLLTENKEDFNLEPLLDYLTQIIPQNQKEAETLYKSVLNFLIRQFNQGKNYHELWFRFTKFGLSFGIFVENNKMDPGHYRNISLSATRLQEYDWALDFIDTYKDYLDPEYRQSAYSFCKARILNNMGNHGGVVEVLRDVEYEDITYNLNSRLLLIAAFYELDEYDALDSTIKAFKVFLRRKHNLSLKRKSNFIDFCDVVHNLIKADDRQDPLRLVKAKGILAANSGIPSTWWLKEKISKMEDVLNINPNDEVVHMSH